MSDIKGNIPKFVLSMGVGQITQSVVKLIEILEKEQAQGTLEGAEEYQAHMDTVSKDEATFKWEDMIPRETLVSED